MVRRGGLPDGERLRTMRDTLRHRGPDDAGDWMSPDRSVWLGQRRLSIIDLSPAGHQPMTDASGELVLVFNGEIYNFQELRTQLEQEGYAFRSRTDSEVILAAYRRWGTECLSRFNGMFAFALYDQAKHQLFLARDRIGKKPLFYYLSHTSGVFAFASELKALLADPQLPRRLAPAALDEYLAYGYVPSSDCLLAGYAKLPPAHALVLNVDDFSNRVWRYWDLPPFEVGCDASLTELVAELERLLADAVRVRLVADVPLGIMLSGGVDSSLLAVLAARQGKVRTFTIGFPGQGALDETAHAQLVASFIGAEHVVLPAEEASPELLPLLARQVDEPVADPSLFPTYLVSKLIRQHATVALGGDGGDELFGGYLHYPWLLRAHRCRQLLPAPLRRLAARLASHLPPGTRGRHHLLGFGESLAGSIAHVNMYFDRDTRARLVPVALEGRPELRRIAACSPRHTPLQQATRSDFRYYLPDDILAKVDRASMAVGLEVRAPWLDYRLVEFAFRHVPDALKATTRQRKVLPKLLAERLLPPAFDTQRKQGFSPPLDAWLRGPWETAVRDVLAGVPPGLLRQDVIAELWTGQQAGRHNGHRLLALAFLELWRREYRIDVP